MNCRYINCGHTEFKYEPVTFKNGTKHFRRICKKCGGFNKYAPESEVISGMGMRPKETKEPEINKKSNNSRMEWDRLFSKIFKLGGQKMVEDFIMEVHEMYMYEKKTSK